MIDFGIEYFNNYAVFVDDHTVKLLDGSGAEVKHVTSERFVIAVGGRPSFGNIPGA